MQPEPKAASAEAVSRNVGGIVLCGGRSSRMGRPKLSLPFGPEVMLQRVVRILSEVVSPIVVVAAPGQPLPDLPQGVLIARDEQEGLGPLAGLAAGFNALRSHADAAFVTACDAPLLQPAFIRYLIGVLGEHDLAIPRERNAESGTRKAESRTLHAGDSQSSTPSTRGLTPPARRDPQPLTRGLTPPARRDPQPSIRGLTPPARRDPQPWYHPLAAVYCTRLEDRVRGLLAAGRMRPLFLVEESNSRLVDVDELRTVDPELHSLLNTNTPEEYQVALVAAGLVPDGENPTAQSRQPDVPQLGIRGRPPEHPSGDARRCPPPARPQH